MVFKIVSWNVNSIRKGVYDEIFRLSEEENPDIICFQETKATGYDAEEFFKNSILIEKYPYRYWNDSVGGQAGVGVWSKTEPLKVLKEVPRVYQLKEGRILILEFEELVLLNTYVPNTGRGDIAEDHRKVWHNALVSWLSKQLESEKLFVWCGDLNVVSDPALDTTHHKVRPKTPIAGLKEFEKEHFDEYIQLGLVDVFRALYPDAISYTWFSNFHSDVGWRLDYFLVNDISKIEDIMHHQRLLKTISDHTWIMLTIKDVEEKRT